MRSRTCRTFRKARSRTRVEQSRPGPQKGGGMDFALADTIAPEWDRFRRFLPRGPFAQSLPAWRSAGLLRSPLLRPTGRSGGQCVWSGGAPACASGGVARVPALRGVRAGCAGGGDGSTGPSGPRPHGAVAFWVSTAEETLGAGGGRGKSLSVDAARRVAPWAADLFGAASILRNPPIHPFPLDAWAASLGEETREVQKWVIFREALRGAVEEP